MRDEQLVCSCLFSQKKNISENSFLSFRLNSDGGAEAADFVRAHLADAILGHIRAGEPPEVALELSFVDIDVLFLRYVSFLSNFHLHPIFIRKDCSLAPFVSLSIEDVHSKINTGYILGYRWMLLTFFKEEKCIPRSSRGKDVIGV